jgi:hypothetical protein
MSVRANVRESLSGTARRVLCALTIHSANVRSLAPGENLRQQVVDLGILELPTLKRAHRMPGLKEPLAWVTSGMRLCSSGSSAGLPFVIAASFCG